MTASTAGRAIQYSGATVMLALLGLLLSALSGLYLSATTFGFIADGSQSEPAFPAHASTGPANATSNTRKPADATPATSSTKPAIR